MEYPSSAIKEMVENAIDAGATKVTVNFVNGGRDLIQIIDNGCGMSPSDARMAFECHATSKIKELEDIYGKLKTLSQSQIHGQFIFILHSFFLSFIIQ